MVRRLLLNIVSQILNWVSTSLVMLWLNDMSYTQIPRNTTTHIFFVMHAARNIECCGTKCQAS